MTSKHCQPRAGACRTLLLILVLAVLPTGCAAPPARIDDTTAGLGVLLMAHGGGEAWNRGVARALQPVGRELPLEIAFGMADAASLDTAVQRLEARGASRIAVVRLLVSGESWYQRTEQILGLAPGAPEHSEVAEEPSHHGHAMEFWRLDTGARFALSSQGLAQAPEMGEVIADRALALSRAPAIEDVLVLAHGPGDDAENRRWLEAIEARADAIRARAPFRRVQVETLREDWPEKRALAEQRIRAFVRRATEEGGRALVVPYRVHGLGPYARVLEGLEYVASDQGLVPHPNVERWVRRQISELRDGPFRPPLGAAPATTPTQP